MKKFKRSYLFINIVIYIAWKNNIIQVYKHTLIGVFLETIELFFLFEFYQYNSYHFTFEDFQTLF